MKKRTKFIMALGVLLIGGVAYYGYTHQYELMHMAHHGPQSGGHAGDHDEVNMPGLRGQNATDQESAELGILFRNFNAINREVENLPNGIRTVTTTSDENTYAALISHVVGMLDRVENLDDPKIIIQSPTLDVFFMRGGEINTQTEVTETGIIVTQTAQDPELIAALQTHAAEVTDMVDRGMMAVHEAMAKRAKKK